LIDFDTVGITPSPCALATNLSPFPRSCHDAWHLWSASQVRKIAGDGVSIILGNAATCSETAESDTNALAAFAEVLDLLQLAPRKGQPNTRPLFRGCTSRMRPTSQPRSRTGWSGPHPDIGVVDTGDLSGGVESLDVDADAAVDFGGGRLDTDEPAGGWHTCCSGRMDRRSSLGHCSWRCGGDVQRLCPGCGRRERAAGRGKRGASEHIPDQRRVIAVGCRNPETRSHAVIVRSMTSSTA